MSSFKLYLLDVFLLLLCKYSCKIFHLISCFICLYLGRFVAIVIIIAKNLAGFLLIFIINVGVG